MTFKCSICDVNPKSHSFEKIDQINDVTIFYSCPGDLVNEDSLNVVNHYKDTLDEYMKEKWTWIIDSKGYKLKQSLHTNNAMKVIRLISRPEYLDKLQNIIIVKANKQFKTIINILWLFLSKNIKEKIQFEN